MIENKETPSFDCSVVVPCYNCANTIRACIASIVAQTLKPKEVIAIDDGSRDNTLELLLALQKEYQEKIDIEVIHQENSGPSKARNEGIRIFHSKMQFGVELALLRTPPPLQGGREEQVASCRDEKRDDALTVPLRLMQYICCGNKNLAIYKYASNPSAKIRNCCSSED